MPLYLICCSRCRVLTLIFSVTDTKYKQLRIRRPVLYVAVYSVGDAPSEVDDFHWAFLVGPSHEEADSKGTLCSMEPRQAPEHRRPYGGEWYWLYNQPTVHLRRQRDLLARLKIAEVASMKILQRIMLRWSGKVNMRQHVEWMSVRWLKQVLKNLDEDEECLGRRIKSFDPVEAEVCTFPNNHILHDGAIQAASLVSVAEPVTPSPLRAF